MDSTTGPILAHASLAQKARHELIRYGAISAYLYITFGALIFYKASILNSQHIAFAAYGLALGKALILGKFILAAHAFKIGERHRPARLGLEILLKSLLFAVILMVLSIIEEVLVGLFRGRQIQDTLGDIAGGTFPQLLATSFLILLIMIPYFAYREVSVSLGEGKLLRLLMERRPAADIQVIER